MTTTAIQKTAAAASDLIAQCLAFAEGRKAEMSREGYVQFPLPYSAHWPTVKAAVALMNAAGQPAEYQVCDDGQIYHGRSVVIFRDADGVEQLRRMERAAFQRAAQWR